MSRAGYALTCLATAAITMGLVTALGSHPPARDNDIIMPAKTFVGLRNAIWARGTLTADWLGYKNNTYSIRCTATGCDVAYAEQIGRNQLSDIQGPVFYEIQSWTEDGDVVAESSGLCDRTTITLSRASQEVLWVSVPINQTEIACKNSDGRVRKATLENSIFWKQPIASRPN
jgi:hypothetical protein